MKVKVKVGWLCEVMEKISEYERLHMRYGRKVVGEKKMFGNQTYAPMELHDHIFSMQNLWPWKDTVGMYAVKEYLGEDSVVEVDGELISRIGGYIEQGVV